MREERLAAHVRARLVYKDPTLLASLEVADVLGEIRNMRSKLATLNYECKTAREGGQKSRQCPPVLGHLGGATRPERRGRHHLR